MKRLSLLFAVTSIALCSQAQSVNMPAMQRERKLDGASKPASVIAKTMRSSVTTGKTTSGASGEWFSFAVAGDDGTVANGSYITTFPDSTLKVTPSSGSPFYWWNHGMGTSFDPTSSLFGSAWANTAVTAPTFVVTSADAYTVDSVEIITAYVRKYNYTDTLYIDIVASSEDSAWDLSLHSATLLSGGYSEDTFLRGANAYYDWAQNGLTSTYIPSVKRITKILDAAAAADTMPGGYNDWVFAIPGGGVNVGAGSKLVAYTHLASGHYYPLNTPIDSANRLLFFTYDLGRVPMQKTGDYNQGLLASTDERYHTSNAWAFSGKPILGFNYLYTSPTIVHDPFYNFHLKCPTCGTGSGIGVKEVASAVTEMNAFPNPASNSLTVSFDLVKNGDATVSITNVVGQVVATQTINNVTSGKATFNTASLANGTYTYTVTANGLKSSARVVIAH